MALNRYVGSFNTGTGTADVVITAPGFTPKAIFFWWTGRTEGADAIGVQNAQVGFGFATGTAARRSISIQSEHAQAQSDCDRVMRDDCCINTITVERAIDGLGDLKSLDANGFTIAIDDQFSRDLRVSYLALGGSDITDAALGTFTQKLTTGDQDITSVGFLPDFVMFISTGQSTVNSLSSRGPHFLSAASGSLPALNATHGHCTNNDAEDMDTCSYCLTNEAPVDMISTTGDVVGRGQVTAWLPNGFRINWVEVDGGENNYFYLAIKGGSWLVGELSTKTDGADIVESGFGFQPAAAMFFSACKVESTSDAVDDGAESSIGAFSATDERSAQGYFDEHGAASSNVITAIEHDGVYVHINSGATRDGVMDIKSVDSDGFTCVMDDPDPSANFVWYFAVGPTQQYKARVGAFNTGTGTADIVEIVGFAPKAIIFWWSGRTETVDAVGFASHQRGLGFAVSPTDRRCTTVRAEHDQADSDTARMFRNDACIASITITADTVDGLADLKSMDSDGFTIEIDSAFSTSLRIHYLALGGSDLTNAVTGSFTPAAGAAPFDQDVTGLGFQPEFLICSTLYTANENSVQPNCNQSIGMATGPSNEIGVLGRSQDGDPAADAIGYGDDGDTVLQVNSGDTNIAQRAEFKEWLSTGFRITWVEHGGGTTQPIYYLALRGGSYSVGKMLTQTDTVTPISVTGLGFRPAGVLFLSACRVESTRDVVTADDELSIGASNAHGARGAQATRDDDAEDPMDVTTAVEHDAVYVNLTDNAVDGLMDIVSFDSGGFSCIMDDADSQQNFVGYAAFGPGEEEAPPELDEFLKVVVRPYTDAP